MIPINLSGRYRADSRQNRREKERSVRRLDSELVVDGTLNPLLAVEISFVFKSWWAHHPPVLHRELARRAAGFVFTRGMRTYHGSVWLWARDEPELSIVLVLLRARLQPPVQFLQPFPQVIPAG